MAKLVRKDDPSVAIIGTQDTILATAYLTGAERRTDGTLEIEWLGESNVAWDSQETQTRDGQIVFIDQNGDEVLENQVELVDE